MSTRIEIQGDELGDALTQAGYLEYAALIEKDKRYVIVKLP